MLLLFAHGLEAPLHAADANRDAIDKRDAFGCLARTGVNTVREPRAFGSMPRFLGHYVREEHLLPLEQAIRKITSLPAQRERLRDRGLLREGFFADITIFDPATIIDKATYENPAEISEGVKYVFVNGKLEYEGGKLTGTIAGRVLRGPGWTGSEITSSGTQN